MADRQGYIVLVPLYRLIPPSNAHDILADVNSLFDYISSSSLAPDGFLSAFINTRIKPDLTRILVVGFSAGGYLCYLSGMVAYNEAKKTMQTPRFVVRGLVLYSAMGGDLLLDTWTLANPKGPGSRRENAERVLARARVYAEKEEVSESPYTNEEEGYDEARDGIFLLWKREECLMDDLTGMKGLGAKLARLPYESRAEAIPRQHHSILPQIFLSDPNFDFKYLPPMILMHGTADTLMPFAESLRTYDTLKERKGAKVELVKVEGGDHFLAVSNDEIGNAMKDGHHKVLKWMMDVMKVGLERSRL